MSDPMRVTEVVGSYRKYGIVDQVTDVILASAMEEGAEVEKIYLVDKNIEFCRNCRTCTQQDGADRGKCQITDDMSSILDEIEHSDSIVLASPMNFGTVTAVMKKFIERLICFAYWPWGMNASKARGNQTQKRAVLIASSAAPAVISRLSSQMVGLLKKASTLLGAKPIGVIHVGLAAQDQVQEITERTKERAYRLGKQLAASSRIQAA